LINDNAIELDLVNSHCKILCDIIKDFQINEKSNTLEMPIQEYDNNRECILTSIQAEYDVSRKASKELFLILSYGGTFTTWRNLYALSKNLKPNSFIKNFQNNIKEIIHYIFEDNTKNTYYLNILNLFQKIKKTEQSSKLIYSSLAIMLQDIETKISYEIMQYLKNDNIDTNVFIHDGIVIDNIFNTKINNEYIIKIQNHIYEKFKFNIKLKKKKIEKTVEDIIWFKKIQKLVDDKTDYKLVLTDKDASDYILDEYLYDKLYLCSKIYYYKENNVWTSINKISELKLVLGRIVSNIDIRIEDEKGNVKPYSQTCVGNNKIIDILIKNIPTKKDLMNLFLSSTKKKLCFLNGIYCFIKKEFIKWEDYNDVIYSLNIINRNFNDNVPQENIDMINSKIWHSMFNNSDVSYIKMCYSRALAGMVTDKSWFVQIGQRNSGKSKLVNFFENAFGDDYIGITNANNFLTDNGSTDEAKKNMWLYDIWSKRIVFSNEFKIDKNVVVDGNKFKSICSGGSDKVELRINHSDPVKLKPQLTLFMNINDLPEIKPADAKQNMVLISLPNQFVRKNEFDSSDKNMRIADETVDEFIENENNIDALIIDIINHFEDVKPCITSNIMKSTNEYKDDQKEIDLFYQNYSFTNNSDDIINVTIINKLLSDELHISPQKIYQLLKKNNPSTTKERINNKYYYTNIRINFINNVDDDM
jgi:hypothetical protein